MHRGAYFFWPCRILFIFLHSVSDGEGNAPTPRDPLGQSHLAESIGQDVKSYDTCPFLL